MKSRGPILAFVIVLAASAPVYAGAHSNFIRDIDFLNFAYPWPPGVRDRSNRVSRIKLRKGRMPELKASQGFFSPAGELGAELGSLVYADVTGDGRDEALVVVNVPACCRGWGINCVYVYGVRRGKPRLLLSVVDSSRDNGTLRDFYGQRGELVIEFWGKESVLTRAGFMDNGGFGPACCATAYTLGRYRWNRAAFHLVSEQTLPNADPNGLTRGPTHLVRPTRP